MGLKFVAARIMPPRRTHDDQDICTSFILLLAACSDEKPQPAQAANEMIGSPLQNNVISSFDTYAPKPTADADGDLVSSLPVRSRSGCADNHVSGLSATDPVNEAPRHC
jgi:hypothetical protein